MDPMSSPLRIGARADHALIKENRRENVNWRHERPKKEWDHRVKGNNEFAHLVLGKAAYKNKILVYFN